jgi:hypothetical protein
VRKGIPSDNQSYQTEKNTKMQAALQPLLFPCIANPDSPLADPHAAVARKLSTDGIIMRQRKHKPAYQPSIINIFILLLWMLQHCWK